MDTPSYPKSDPSLLLLNEIEILLAQTRLMELYLKQAQVTAANEAARVQEQHQAELTALRHALAEKEQLLVARQSAASEQEKKLFEQFQNLHREVSDQKRRLDECRGQLLQVDSEAAALRGQIDRLEAAKAEAEAATQLAESTRRELQSTLTTLRQELESNQRDFQRQQLVSRALQENLSAQLEQLREQLTEQQAWASAGAELQQARSEIAELRHRIADLQASRREIEAAATQVLEQSRARFETELAGLRTALSERDRNLREAESAIGTIERRLSAEAGSLRVELGEKQGLIDSRDRELRGAHGQIAALQERIVELEAAQQEAASSTAETHRSRVTFESEIAALRHEVAVRERELNERQEAVTAVELALHGKIQALQQEVARGRSAIEARASDVQKARAEADVLRERISQLESAAETSLAARCLAEDARTALELELTRINDVVAHKEALVAEHERRIQSLENQLRGEITDLRNQLKEQKELVEQGHYEVERVRSEIALLQEQKAQSEHSYRELEQNWQQARVAREELEGRLQAKDHELRAAYANADGQKETELRELEARFKSTEEQQAAELALMRSQLDQQRTNGELVRQELVRLQTENSSLRDQHTRSETSRREFEQNWREAAAFRQELEAGLQAKEEELRTLRSSADEEKSAALSAQETRYQALEAQLGSEIGHLRFQLEQQQRDFVQGNNEISQLRAETAALHEQREMSEQARRELEQHWQQAAALRQDFERRLHAKEAELHTLQSRASEEIEGALREQQARFKSTEAQFNHELAHLRSQLDEQRTANKQAREEFARLQAEISGLREQTGQSEVFRRELEQSSQQAYALREDYEARLRAKEDELCTAQVSADAVKGQVEAKLAELQIQLRERQLLADSRAAEIHDLKGEIGRLSEQAAARDSAAEELGAMLQGKSEAARVAHQAEIAALREEQSALQRRLEEQNAGLLRQIQELEKRAAGYEAEIQAHAQEMAATMGESASLRERAQQLEDLRLAEKAAAENAAEQVRSQLEPDLASLRHELQQKTWALAQQQASVENLADAHRAQIQKLEEKLDEQQRNFQYRRGEAEGAQAQARSLQRRIDELEIELQQAQFTAAQGAEQVREAYTVQIEELNAQVLRQRAALQEREATQSQWEQDLRAEMERLVREAQEKTLILQSRNDELVQAKSERDSLQQNYQELATATTRNETAMSVDTERMRTEFQAQLALLQAELSQKEWALEEQRAAASGMDQQYREQIESLRRQLAQLEARGQESPEQFVIGDDALTEEQKERYKKYREVVDTVTSGADPSFPASENRRWRSRFGWKRRWK